MTESLRGLRQASVIGALGCGLLCAGVAAAQGPAPAPARVSHSQRRDIELNGPLLNGTDLGAPRSLAVVRLRDPARGVDGKPLSGLRLDGTALVAGAAPLVRAVLSGLDTAGQPVQIRIDGVNRSKDADVTLYQLSYERAGAWRPVCRGTEQALALPGRWDYHLTEPGDSGRLSSDPGEVTFACQGGALAKCVLHEGYKPWRSAQEDALHQACVRALRADYCGNGVSMTFEGQKINLYDLAGVRKDTETWTSEARWTAAGATCVHSTRLKYQPVPPDSRKTVDAYVRDKCPHVLRDQPCAPVKGDPPATLFTEHPPRP